MISGMIFQEASQLTDKKTNALLNGITLALLCRLKIYKKSKNYAVLKSYEMKRHGKKGEKHQKNILGLL
jgi:hypothetical protein